MEITSKSYLSLSILMCCIEKSSNERGFVESKTIGVDVALNRKGTTGVTLFNYVLTQGTTLWVVKKTRAMRVRLRLK